ncbi:MAG: T9SS type A sorting domain-containing protein [Candidatus Delongbacteria bacterium]|nr:T9SS type A sorting domain-containing protein [Candidatus Delongbacteria bacterium]
MTAIRSFLSPAALLLTMGLPLLTSASGDALVPWRDLPQASWRMDLNRQPQAGPVWQQFLASNPGFRIMDWDRHKAAPHRVIGGKLALPGGPPTSAEQLDQSLRTFVGQNHELLAVTPAELVTESISLHGQVWYAHYHQQLHGLPVVGSEVTFRVSAAGNLMLLGSDAWSALELRPAHFGSQELEARLRAASSQPVLLSLADEGSWLVPMEDPDGRFRAAEPARVYELASEDGLQRDRVWISEHTGEILRAHSLIRHLTVNGQLLCAVEPQAPGDALENWPLAWAELSVNGVSTTTDENGDYSVDVPGTGPWTVTGQYRGLYADVNRQDAADTQWSLNQSVNGATMVLNQGQITERDAYIHTGVTHDFIKDMDQIFDGLDEPLPVNINIGQTCNAFWDGSSINFFMAGNNCPNTARVAGVVYHEYGHGINDRQYRQAGAQWGMENGAMHEGLADVNAIYIQDESYVSPGWNIRNLNNTNSYPWNISGEVHADGMIIGGAMYDLRLLLPLDTVRPLYHYARWGRPDDSETGRAFFEYFLELLVADDDNGDLSDLCPHFDEIDQAFNEHGIGSVLAWTVTQFTLEDPVLTTPPELDHGLLYTIDTPEWISVEQLILHWRIAPDGPFADLQATPLNQSQWQVSLPAQPAGTWVEYWAEALNGANVPLSCPTGAPETLYRLYFGPASLQLVDFEADDGEGQPDTPWQWGVPDNGPSQAFSGQRLWGTNLTGAYTDNLDAGLVFPTRTVSGNGPVGLRFMHWRSIEAGWDGGTVEVSINSGPWQVVTPAGGYDFSTPDNSARPGTPCFTGSVGWEQVGIDLSLLVGAGDQVALRFSLITDTFVTEAGWFIDDLEYMGFTGTGDFVHTPLPDTENVAQESFDVVARLNAPVVPESVTLEWRFNQDDAVTVAMSPGELPGEWNATIPGPGAEGTVYYRLQASGPDGYHSSAPPFEGEWYSFSLGEDRELPTVAWRRYPVNTVFERATWQLEALAQDNLGVATVQLFSRPSGGEWQADVFLEPAEDGLWRTEVEIFDGFGVHEYKLVATDAGSLANTADTPVVEATFGAAIEDGFEDPALPLWFAEGAWTTNAQIHHGGEASLSYGVPGQLPLDADAALTFVQCLDLGMCDAGSGVLRFWRLHNLETGDDRLCLDVREDGGEWSERDSWTGQSNGWQFTEVDLGGCIWGCVELRFRASLDGDNDPTQSSILLIDDLRIEYAATAVDPAREGPETFGITGAWPNPFNPSTRVAFRMPLSGAARLELYNLQGQLLRVLHNGPLPAGEHTLMLDGSGLASGLYLLRLESQGRQDTRKVMLVK